MMETTQRKKERKKMHFIFPRKQQQIKRAH